MTISDDSIRYALVRDSFLQWLKIRNIKVPCIHLNNHAPIEFVSKEIDLSALQSVHFENISKDSIPILADFIRRVSSTLVELHLSQSLHLSQELYNSSIEQCELLEVISFQDIRSKGLFIISPMKGKDENAPSLDFSKFKMLRKLTLLSCSISTDEDKLLMDLTKGCPELTVLHADITVGNNALPKLLRACPKLKSVTLKAVVLEISDDTFVTQVAAYFNKIEHWDVGFAHGPIDNRAVTITAMNHMPNLKSLTIEGSPDIIKQVCINCPMLTDVNTEFVDNGLSTVETLVVILSQLRHLRRISGIGHCLDVQVGDKSQLWKCLFDRFETVTKVDITNGVIEGTYNPGTHYVHIPGGDDADDFTAVIVNGMKQYTTLSYCCVNDKCLQPAFIHCAHTITVLDLRYITDVKFVDIAPLLDRCTTALRVIVFPENVIFTDSDLLPFITRCGAELTRFELNFNNGVTNSTLITIAKHCLKLEELLLKMCDYLGAEGFYAVATGCHRLRCLDVTYCHGFTTECLETLLNNCRTLNSVVYDFTCLSKEVAAKARRQLFCSNNYW